METRRRRRHRLNPINNTQIKQSLHLPEEIVEEILARVAVKSLLRFRCVSKAWRSLISSERFIKIHLENTEKNTSLSHHGVIFSGSRSSAVKQFPLQPLLNDPSSLDPSPIFDPATHRRKAGYVVAHCNGLVCIIKENSLFLWNPATRISRKIKEGGWIPDTNFGFGWDEASGAYKVADIGSNRKCDVYSLKTNSWKSIGQNDHGFLYGQGEFLGGKLHWLGGSQQNVANYVVTLDMKSEAFGKMELPCCGGVLVRTLAVLRGFMSFLNHNMNGLSLWVMKDYGVKESWENVMTIPLEFSPTKFITPLYMGLNGEILLLYESTFLVYNPHRGEDVRLLLMEIKCRWPFRWYYSKRSAFVYIKTLVSPFTSSPES